MKFSELQRLQRMEGITVLSADERIEQLEARLRTITKERDGLRARIEEMDKQESVATVIKEGDSRYWMSERLWTFPDGKYPLYALPGAKGEEK